eukprot:SAG31_NODE_24840_length_473_cov_1.085561_1_plen_52_part_10
MIHRLRIASTSVALVEQSTSLLLRSPSPTNPEGRRTKGTSGQICSRAMAVPP